MYSWSDVAVRTACVYDAAAASTRDDALLPRMQRCAVCSLPVWNQRVCVYVEGVSQPACKTPVPQQRSPENCALHPSTLLYRRWLPTPSLLPNHMLPISRPWCAQVCRMRPVGRLRLCRCGNVWTPVLALAGVVGACQQRRGGGGLASGQCG